MSASSAMTFQHVHMIGVGGIQMSAVAKLLHRAGISVSGSDTAVSPQTEELKKLGISVAIGHDASHVSPNTDLVIYTSAIPELNVERAEARRRNIPQQTNFAFLGEWLAERRVILVTGTHGKSTTTAMLGLICEHAGLDPMVIVGSKVPQFPDGNIRFGHSDLVIVEGDEYERHFLQFHPVGVIINNLEWDHTDIFPELSDLVGAFRELLSQVQDHGLIVANADDPHVSTLIGQERTRLEARGVKIVTFGCASHADVQITDQTVQAEGQQYALRDESGLSTRMRLSVPGKMNVMNAAAATVMARGLKGTFESAKESLASFRGIWRRFEKISDQNGIVIVSDYAHHPTAVAATLEAAKSFYPGRRLVVCFQPHQRNRTRHLFLDFVSSFDRADLLIFCEIYDVAGREKLEDQDISSRDLQDAVIRHDADRSCIRQVDFASNPEESRLLLKRLCKTGDVVLVMGAGDIYKIAPQLFS